MGNLSHHHPSIRIYLFHFNLPFQHCFRMFPHHLIASFYSHHFLLFDHRIERKIVSGNFSTCFTFFSFVISRSKLVCGVCLAYFFRFVRCCCFVWEESRKVVLENTQTNSPISNPHIQSPHSIHFTSPDHFIQIFVFSN